MQEFAVLGVARSPHAGPIVVGSGRQFKTEMCFPSFM